MTTKHTPTRAQARAATIASYRGALAQLTRDNARLVEALRAAIEWADLNKQRAGTMPVASFRALLAELDGVQS